MERQSEGGEPQGRLGDFIDEHRQDIMSAWEERVREAVPTATTLDDSALRNNLPQVLRWIADAVRADHGGEPKAPSALPELHAQSRVQEGYELIELVRELSVLRLVILERWRTVVSPVVHVEEGLRLHAAIDQVIARSVRTFAQERQRETLAHLDIEQHLIGIVSHDLRNPLTTISVAAEGLLRHPQDNRTTRGLVRIRNAALRSGRLIRDLLDFTRARLGTGIPVAPVSGDLHAIARDVLADVGAGAAERDIAHTEEGDARADLDPDRVAQVIENLVLNAIKYSPADTCVTVVTRGEEEAVILSVHNWGEPIAEEARGRLFQPLQRAVAPGASHEGLGLGLYIVDQIVRAHGGTVAVTSAAEQGTLFTVRLPRAGAKSAPPGDRAGT